MMGAKTKGLAAGYFTLVVIAMGAFLGLFYGNRDSLNPVSWNALQWRRDSP